MSNPVDELRAKLELQSNGIAELINKHPESKQLQAIGDYIENLQTLVQAQTAQMSVKRYINETNQFHNHLAPQRQDIKANNFRPQTNVQNNVNTHQYTEIPRETVFYQLSKTIAINPIKMNYLKDEEIYFDNHVLKLSTTELSRLKSFLNSDFSTNL